MSYPTKVKAEITSEGWVVEVYADKDLIAKHECVQNQVTGVRFENLSISHIFPIFEDKDLPRLECYAIFRALEEFANGEHMDQLFK